MNRTHGALSLALLTLSGWLLVASACSRGSENSSGTAGTSDVARAEGGAGADGSGDVDTDGVTGERLPAGDAPVSSPFDSPTGDPTEALTDGSGTAPGIVPDTPAGGDGPVNVDSGPAAEPSTTDNGPELQRPVGEGGDTATIAGVWDYSRTGDDGVDTVVFEIDASGGLVEYDYQNDAAGTGVECNVLRRAGIASSGNDRYDIQDTSSLPGSTSIDDVLITVDGAEIVFRYIGNDTDPQFNGGQIGITERFPMATGTDLRTVAECT